MTLENFLATEAIRKTITQYTIAGDSRNRALFNDIWTEDALLEFEGFSPLPGFRCEGIAAIHARSADWKPWPSDPNVSGTSFFRHNLTTCHIELTSQETARALTYFIVTTDIGPDHSGTYTDKLRLSGERWLFNHRHIALDWRSSKSLFPAVAKEN